MLMQKEFPMHYDFFPKTYLLPNELSEFKNQFKSKEELEAERAEKEKVIAIREAEKKKNGVYGCRSPTIIQTNKADDRN